MTPTDTRQVLQALQRSDHKYIAIRPADSTPQEAPAIVLSEPTANALAYAMNTAGENWPDCSAWSLIGSDELLLQIDPSWPPTMRALRTPVEIATFSCPM